MLVYDSFVALGRAPTISDLAAHTSGATDASGALERLDAAHLLVLERDRSSIRMAMPFSAHDVGYTVNAGDRSWWANCAWDALAVPVVLGCDASIEAHWLDDGSPVDLHVVDGELSSFDGFVHFTVPARSWWDDIVET